MIRLQKCLKKATAVVLVITMLWLLPIDAYGASASEDNETQKYSSGIEEKQPNILCEDSQKRDTYTKHFKLDGGSFMAVQYESPVNYKDKNGNWVEYDNTMVAENTASSDSTSTQDEALSDFDYSNKKSNIDITTTKIC